MIMAHKIKPEFYEAALACQDNQESGVFDLLGALGRNTDADDSPENRVAISGYLAKCIAADGATQNELDVISYELLMPANEVIEYCKINDCSYEFHPIIAKRFKVTAAALSQWLFILGVAASPNPVELEYA